METAPTRLRQGIEARRLGKRGYEKELERLQMELVRMQEWIVHEAAGGGAVRGPRHGRQGRHDQAHHRADLTRARAARGARHADRARASQWYFQRYVAHLPAAGEIVLFDRSWYNRAGVEHVMGFCTQDEYEEFLRTCPQFERTCCAGDHPRQVLAVGQRRGAGAPLQKRACTTRASAGSSAPSTCRLARAGSTTPRPRTACSRTPTRASPVVRRRGRRQAHDAAEPDQPPAEAHPLPGVGARTSSFPRARSGPTCARPARPSYVPARYVVGPPT